MDSHTNNIVVFTIGRMNPPTPGHMLLIEKLILRALSLGQTKIGIIVSHSQDIPKNPLYCAEKRDAILPAMIRALKEQMKTRMPHVSPESIDGIEPIIICMDEIPNLENPPKSMLIRSVVKLLELYNYREIPIEKMHLIIGQDRASQYGFIQETLLKLTPPIIIPGGMDVEALPRPEGAISATEIRGYAMNGDWPNFLLKMQSTGIEEERLRELFNHLHELLTAPGPVAKKVLKKGGRSRNKTRFHSKNKKTKTNKKTKKRKAYRRSK